MSQPSESKPVNVVSLGDEICRIEARGQFTDKDAQDYVPNPESGQLRVDVAVFEGPLDLLLHLIKKHSMDIFDIPITVITHKYLEVLDQMESLDLDVAGEFFLMAATLAQIKSKMLLPQDPKAQEDDEDGTKDPRAELVRRLLEYQRVKEGAQALAAKCQLGSDVFFRTPEEQAFWLQPGEEEINGQRISPVEAFELIDLFARALRAQSPDLIHTVRMDPVSVRARVTELIDFTRTRENFSFDDALSYFRAQNRFDIILTFLAILEMARLKLLTITQDNYLRPVALSGVVENLKVANEELLESQLAGEEGGYGG